MSRSAGEGPPFIDEQLPFISVLIPTCGRPQSLGAALDSLIGQSYPRLEIVVVDNRPENPETRTLLRKDYPGCRYQAERRRGVAFARNCGLAAAKGEVVLFLDDDCRCRGDWLKVIGRRFAGNDSLGCCTGPIFPLELETRAQLLMERRGGFSKGGEARLFGRERPDCGKGILVQTWRFGTGANMAFRRDFLREIGGFDETLRTAEDLDIFFRVLRAGMELAYEPEAVVFHRHVSGYGELRKRLFFWGWGYTALLTKIARVEPEFRSAALREILGWFAYQIGERLGAAVRGAPEALPLELVLSEIVGGACGIPGYFGDRRRAQYRRRRGKERRQPREPFRSGFGCRQAS